jgi:hypothetical protein
MAVFPRGNVWWYKFYFAGQFIRESSKSTSKTVAKNAETQRRRELEQGFNNVPKRREILRRAGHSNNARTIPNADRQKNVVEWMQAAARFGTREN